MVAEQHYALFHKRMERENYREIPEIITLYHQYHYNRKVKRTGQERWKRISADNGSAESSSFRRRCRVMWLQKYEDHPIIRFYNQHLVSYQKQLEECAQLSVSINTDDKGIFSASLENEYALMACALE